MSPHMLAARCTGLSAHHGPPCAARGSGSRTLSACTVSGATVAGCASCSHMWPPLLPAGYDGTAYVEHCPIRAGSSFTYRFRVDEPPGTYMW